MGEVGHKDVSFVCLYLAPFMSFLVLADKGSKMLFHTFLLLLGFACHRCSDSQSWTKAPETISQINSPLNRFSRVFTTGARDSLTHCPNSE